MLADLHSAIVPVRGVRALVAMPSDVGRDTAVEVLVRMEIQLFEQSVSVEILYLAAFLSDVASPLVQACF